MSSMGALSRPFLRPCTGLASLPARATHGCITQTQHMHNRPHSITRPSTRQASNTPGSSSPGGGGGGSLAASERTISTISSGSPSPSLNQNMKVGFIGAGLMAQALCRGFIASALVRPSQILASDINRSKLRAIRELGVETTTDNAEVVERNEVVIVAVKPYIVNRVLQEVSQKVHKNSLFVSVAAGITVNSMEKILPSNTRVVRVMSNTPAVVQSAASVFTLGTSANGEDADLVTEMFNCVGLVEQMPEYLMDAVTGLSGNGPAYGYVIIQALADGGVKMGLNRDQSIRLAAQLLLGSAKMVLDTKGHPEALKDQVCSPGGTSAHALHKMEKAGLRGALIDGVEAGTLRSKEIGLEYQYQDLQMNNDSS